MQFELDRSIPLIETGILYAQTHDRASNESLPYVRLLLSQYIKGIINYQQCFSEVQRILSSAECVNRVRAILTLPDKPPPYCETNISINGKKTIRQWTAEEDMRLIGGIYRYGIADWAEISKFVGNGRTRSQCSQRWHRSLNPGINKDRWDPIDDYKLIQAVRVYGDHAWTKIAQVVGRRTDVQCRYRYKLLSHKNSSEYVQNPFASNLMGLHNASNILQQKTSSPFNQQMTLTTSQSNPLFTPPKSAFNVHSQLQNQISMVTPQQQASFGANKSKSVEQTKPSQNHVEIKEEEEPVIEPVINSSNEEKSLFSDVDLNSMKQNHETTPSLLTEGKNIFDFMKLDPKGNEIDSLFEDVSLFS